MALPGLQGLWDLNGPTINRVISTTSPGNYALGYVKDRTFFALYVGRSDDDLNDRLHRWTSNPRYRSFKASYASGAIDAFMRECRNYHECGGSEKLDNDIHPCKPEGIDVVCPVCGR